MNIKKYLNFKSLLVPEWCCAIRFNEDNNVFVLDSTKTEFIMLNNSYRYWTADPFLFKNNDKYYLFFEAYDRLKRKGVIGVREISEHSFGKINIIYQSNNHLSYPFIYRENNDIYILPESCNSGELFRLRCIDFPYKWEKEKIIANERLLDTTLFDYKNRRYYISQRAGFGAFDRVDLFYDDDNGIFTECKNNPVKVDVNTARGAGKIFNYKDKLIRPSQDCGKYYGEKLNFNEVKSITESFYEEELIKTICVSDIKVEQKRNLKKHDIIGIHTYNKLDNIEVIDLKTANNFNLFNLIGAFVKRIKKRIKIRYKK